MEKISNKFTSTALIDADYIIWIACNPNKVMNQFGHPLKEAGKYVYTDKTLQEAINTCDTYMNDILNITHADSYILYLTTGETFRHKLDDSYKANRVGMEKPLWFKEVKQHLADQWGAIEVEGLEADDLVSITKNYLPNSFIIAADKDVLDCIPGRHFDARKNKSCFIETSREEAIYNFAISLLTGDAIDGVPNLIKGMGPKTAETELLLRMENNNPIISALQVFISYLGQYQGISRFSRQYQLLKILENLEQLPEGVKFAIPEPICFNCVETIISDEAKGSWEYLD